MQHSPRLGSSAAGSGDGGGSGAARGEVNASTLSSVDSVGAVGSDICTSDDAPETECILGMTGVGAGACRGGGLGGTRAWPGLRGPAGGGGGGNMVRCMKLLMALARGSENERAGGRRGAGVGRAVVVVLARLFVTATLELAVHATVSMWPPLRLKPASFMFSAAKQSS